MVLDDQLCMRGWKDRRRCQGEWKLIRKHFSHKRESLRWDKVPMMSGLLPVSTALLLFTCLVTVAMSRRIALHNLYTTDTSSPSKFFAGD